MFPDFSPSSCTWPFLHLYILSTQSSRNPSASKAAVPRTLWTAGDSCQIKIARLCCCFKIWHQRTFICFCSRPAVRLVFLLSCPPVFAADRRPLESALIFIILPSLPSSSLVFETSSHCRYHLHTSPPRLLFPPTTFITLAWPWISINRDLPGWIPPWPIWSLLPSSHQITLIFCLLTSAALSHQSLWLSF